MHISLVLRKQKLPYDCVSFGKPSSLQTHLCELVGQLHAVDAAVGSNVAFTADVNVHFTN